MRRRTRVSRIRRRARADVTTERRDAAASTSRAEVRETIDGQAGSAVLVYVPHTTAGLTINEHADPMVARDFERALERIVAEGWGWQHIEDGEENAPSHIRASLMGPAGARPAARRRARARHLAGHLLLRARRAAHALRVRHGAAVAAGVRDGRSRSARPGARADDRSLAFGGNGVARLDGFVVFVRRGLPGDTVRARVTKVQRRHAEASRSRCSRPARSGSTRRARTTPRAAAAASRISPTTRRSQTKEQWVADSLQRLAGLADAAARADRPRGEHLPLPQQDGVLVHARRRRRRRSACTAPAAGTRCSRSSAAG